ncbi:MAG: class II glutamine amidotransferase [Candidatus Roizmanbacteria bacterium]|nr:class II glutamine amidotransferase [Candidatus Roizmanbacteria bacterium]
MCRFLLAKSREKQDPTQLLESFADMAQKSKAYDGDWQGDGWGASWWNGRSWEQYVSLKPVWEDREFFSFIPETSLLCIHARSASFERHKNTIEFNQPYIQGRYAFVFNGLLKGVTLPHPLSGTIGAQKIWSLLQIYLKKYSPENALKRTVTDLNKHSRFIQALNIGLSDGKNIYAYTQYATHPQYYHLGHSTSKETTIVVSEQIEGYEFEAIKQSQVTKW